MSEDELRVLAEVQRLPLTQKPFEDVAQRLDMTEYEVMNLCSGLLDKGVIRRFCPSINHRQLGYVANPMIVLNVPEDKLDEVGKLIAQEPEVTHCYARSGWDYNLFFMIHARTREEGSSRAKMIVDKTGIGDYRMLFSTKEFKKISFEIPRPGESV